jgi:hypothetical protein
MTKIRSWVTALARIGVAAAAVMLVAGCAFLDGLARDDTFPAQGGTAGPTAEADQRDTSPVQEEPGDTPSAESSADTESATQPEDAPEAAVTVPVRTLAQGLQSAIRFPATRAVTNPAAYTEFWRAITANDASAPAEPDVDFGAEQVIVVLMGERPTAGYAVNIVSVVDVGSEIEVEIDVRQPAPGDVVAQVVTAPFLIAAIPFPDVPVRFTGESPELGFEGD